MEDKEIRKHLSKVSETLGKIPYKYCYVEVRTETDKYVFEKDKPTSVIGFRGGAVSE